MDLHSDRRYRFDIEPPTLWDAISSVDDYRAWWPWLREFDARGLVAGDSWRCVVQPPLPYSLRFSISLDEVDPPRLVRATVSGDVSGSARLEIDERDPGCEARLTSALSPRHGALRFVSLLARPLAQFGHDWVLDTGTTQFVARAV